MFLTDSEIIASTGTDINRVKIGLRASLFTRVLHTGMPVREYYWAGRSKIQALIKI